MAHSDAHTQLSDTARRELIAERDRLAAARDFHDAELKKAAGLLYHLEAILGTGNGAAPPTTTNGQPRQIGSLREAIEGVLVKHPQGMKPLEVTRMLEAAGYEHTGAISLALERLEHDVPHGQVGPRHALQEVRSLPAVRAGKRGGRRVAGRHGEEGSREERLEPGVCWCRNAG